VNPSEAYNRGVSDIAEADTPETQVAARVLELARVQRRQNAIRAALDRAATPG
jgi:hypothetical protein